MTNIEVADRLFNAILVGDAAALDALFAIDAVLWQNFVGRDIPRDEFLPTVLSVAATISGLHLEGIRRTGTPNGFVEQHTICGRAPSGAPVAIHGCFIGTVADGKITRLNEYLDSAQRPQAVAAGSSS